MSKLLYQIIFYITCNFSINASIYASGASRWYSYTCGSIYDTVWISCGSSINPSSNFIEYFNCPKYYIEGDTRDYVIEEINNMFEPWFQMTLANLKKKSLDFVTTQKALVETLYDTSLYNKQTISEDAFCTIWKYTGVGLCNGREAIYFNKK